MEVLSEQKLLDKVRNLADNAQNRIWIAVPYLGSYETVQLILGSAWLTAHKISFRLIIDVNELNGVSASTVGLLRKRGAVKSLAGLHAKIFIIDDKCIVGSANLTRTSFTKRYEAAILLRSSGSRKIVSLFERFWKQAVGVSDTDLNIPPSKNHGKEDEGKNKGLVTISRFHKTQFVKGDRLSKKYLSYNSLVAQFRDFGEKYKTAIGRRLWPQAPLYYEVDSFLNFLFQFEPRPSHRFKYNKGRKLTAAQQFQALKRWIEKFHVHVRTGRRTPNNFKSTTRLFKAKLSSRRINQLQWTDIQDMLWKTNAGSSQPINITRITNNQNNDLRMVRRLLLDLVSGDAQLEWRIYQCDKNIFGMSSALINEILHFYEPDQYPLINLRSCSGMRFFGYQINVHLITKKRR